MASNDELLFSASRFRVVRRRRTDAAGNVHAREIIEHPGAVTILPLLADGTICLIRNFRMAVGQTLIELPAGTLSPGEDPLEAAHRELAEETGYQADSIKHLHSFWMSPGVLQERMHLFLATGLRAGKAALEEGEEIQPLIVPWQEALAMTRDGRIQDAKTLVGLLFFDPLRNDQR
jgi:ADP-ribose pyrophosphatase